jgi:hypothetical protein
MSRSRPLGVRPISHEERDRAIEVASSILDQVGLDPDDDIAVICRQFLRAIDCLILARRHLHKGRALWNGPCHQTDAVLAWWDTPMAERVLKSARDE